MKVYSIFRSIDGEVNSCFQGRQTTFIRLSGCNLSCKYCDTKYAQDINSGKDMSISEIAYNLHVYNVNKVTITGGEPLLQQDELLQLVRYLNSEGYLISLETNGSIPIPDPFYKYVDSFVIDYKVPSSGMMEDMVVLNEDVQFLRKTDFIKFVISDKADFHIAGNIHSMIRKRNDIVNIAFSPVQGLEPRVLMDWIESEESLNDVILNLQLHKIIWPEINGNNER